MLNRRHAVSWPVGGRGEPLDVRPRGAVGGLPRPAWSAAPVLPRVVPVGAAPAVPVGTVAGVVVARALLTLLLRPELGTEPVLRRRGRPGGGVLGGNGRRARGGRGL